jgi:type IV secretion system protein VirD4
MDEESIIILIVLIAVALLITFRKKVHRVFDACGTAQWSNLGMLAKKNMVNAGRGVILGYALDTGRQNAVIWLPEAVHTSVFAPTGAGKGVSLIIPYLVTNTERSAVVVDFKGENAWLTAAAREAMGHKIVILDPWSVVTGGGANKFDRPSDRFYSVDWIEPESALAFDECRSAAAAMVVREKDEGKNKHWNDYCEKRLAAALAVVAIYGSKEKGTRNLQTMADMVNDPAKWANAVELMTKSTRWGGMLAREGQGLGAAQGEEAATHRSVMARHTTFLNSEVVAKNTRDSTFNPAMLKRGRMTIYLVMPPRFMREYSGLLRLWVDSLMKAVIREGLDERNKVDFIIDEAAQLMGVG